MARLDAHLERLCTLFPAARGRAPLLLAEASRVRWHDGRMEVRRSDLRPRDEYAPRFEALANSGFGWINLNLFGWLGGAALVLVELPRVPVGCPADRVAVNLSGPWLGADGTPRWDATDRVRIVEDAA